MFKNKNFILIFLSLILFSIQGCHKRRPPKGEYIFIFTYDSPNNVDATFKREILESNKDWLTIAKPNMGGPIENLDTLYKDGMKVKGTIVLGLLNSRKVMGVISRDKGSKFKITGTYVSHIEVQGNVYEYPGTFSITKE